MSLLSSSNVSVLGTSSFPLEAKVILVLLSSVRSLKNKDPLALAHTRIALAHTLIALAHLNSTELTPSNSSRTVLVLLTVVFICFSSCFQQFNYFQDASLIFKRFFISEKRHHIIRDRFQKCRFIGKIKMFLLFILLFK